MGYLAGLVVLQPALKVGSISPRIEAASLQVLDRPRGRCTCSHHRVEGVVEGGRVLVGFLVLRSSHAHTSDTTCRLV